MIKSNFTSNKNTSLEKSVRSYSMLCILIRAISYIFHLRNVVLNFYYPTGGKFSLQFKFRYISLMANSLILNSAYYYMF